jgi:anaerobic selenocysteine-containing dehydrogenase/Fe-S-cluster-containing dehydrogenase component
VNDPSEKVLSRRTFLKIAGAAGAGVTAGCSPQAATQKVIPFLIPPEDIVPGTPLYYRTVCRECSASCGVTARTREGRVVKLEGNPEDPIGRGALCARGQASLQALYSPDRFKGAMRRGPDGSLSPISWDEAEDQLSKSLTAARERGPGSIRMITRPEPGSAGAFQTAFLRALGARSEDRVVLDPLDPAPLRAAGDALFGRSEVPVFDLAKARSIVCFGAEIVETWVSPVEYARQLAEGRGRVGEGRTRLTWVGPRLSLTGYSADSWIRARAGGELAVALGLLRWIVDPAHEVPNLAPEFRSFFPQLARLEPSELSRRADVPWTQIERLAKELAHRRPSALLGPGVSSQGPDATQLAAVVMLINVALGNLGQSVHYGLDALKDPPSSMAEIESLLADMAAGRVQVLLVHHADPLGVMPAVAHAEEALSKVPLVVSFGDRPDSTTSRARLVLPDHHTLEAWGDASPRVGIVNLCQPAMTPLADTRAASQVLLEVGRKLPFLAAHFPWPDFYDYTQTRAETYAMVALGKFPDLLTVQRDALQRGGYYSYRLPARAQMPELLADAADAFLSLPPLPPAGGEFDLVIFPTVLRGDGRNANLPWLREVPDTVSTVSWSPWAEISPATAKRLGIVTGDLVVVSTSAGRTEIAAYVYPGLRDDVVAIPLGFPATAVQPAARDELSGATAFRSARAGVSPTGKRVRLPLLEGSPYQHGREIVRTVSAAAPVLHRPDLSEKMYGEPEHPVHRWGMVIDLDKCTGCNACVVACFAENNVPVMGPEAAAKGRYMGWIRIERYLGDEPGDALDVKLLPMLCQQCTNAPCEPVCPVYATYHTAEGLNAQVYNRCVGTRYCSNNCPYKVRTFNWRDAQFPPPLNMQLNPDVTVRSRGVMEKCTFCVQRIRYAENQARDEQRAVRDGEVMPACAQTCPAKAIVFGDLKDANSSVARLSREERGFRALAELNTQPAITYLARVHEKEEP